MVYCAQAQHCQQGMVSFMSYLVLMHLADLHIKVMAINPSQNGATSLAAYQKITANANTNTPADPGVVGGTLANAPQAQAKGKGKKAKKAKGAAGLAAALGKGKAARKLRV
jgi:hypothetical protein